MYKRHARRVAAAIEEEVEGAEVEVVVGKSKSFEIIRVGGEGKEEEEGEALLWSGKSKGPPRRLKFPDDDEVRALLSK